MFVRAHVRRVRVSVNATAIQSLYEPGGDVWNFGRKFGEGMVIAAIRRAPRRTGELAARHGYTNTPIGAFQVRTTLHNDAPYAGYVRYGTGDIYGRMIVRPFPHSYYAKPTFRNHVRGQRPNNWMEEALQEAIVRYGL
jgi:hypothetical protein